MTVKTYYPALCTPNFEETVKELEALGFTKAHEKNDIAEHNNTNMVMKDGNGNKVDVVSLSSMSAVKQSFTAIRMNVENYDEAYAELTAKGFIDLHPGTVETKSSKSTMLRSKEGFMYILTEHVK